MGDQRQYCPVDYWNIAIKEEKKKKREREISEQSIESFYLLNADTTAHIISIFESYLLDS